jgi:hypothetical protein
MSRLRTSPPRAYSYSCDRSVAHAAGARKRLVRGASALSLALLAALALGACGDSHTRVTTGTYAGEAGDAAPYLNVGPLVYEVQLSRELNPANAEDAAYLQGVAPSQRTLHPGEEWFGLFIQVYNQTSTPHLGATNITITDTEHNLFTPLALDQTNDFAYRGGEIPAHSRVPAPGTVAADGGSQGALLLYKIPVASLDNRPWTLRIVDPNDAAQSASATLDV